MMGAILSYLEPQETNIAEQGADCHQQQQQQRRKNYMLYSQTLPVTVPRGIGAPVVAGSGSRTSSPEQRRPQSAVTPVFAGATTLVRAASKQQQQQQHIGNNNNKPLLTRRCCVDAPQPSSSPTPGRRATHAQLAHDDDDDDASAVVQQQQQPHEQQASEQRPQQQQQREQHKLHQQQQQQKRQRLQQHEQKNKDTNAASAAAATTTMKTTKTKTTSSCSSTTTTITKSSSSSSNDTMTSPRPHAKHAAERQNFQPDSSHQQPKATPKMTILSNPKNITMRQQQQQQQQHQSTTSHSKRHPLQRTTTAGPLGGPPFLVEQQTATAAAASAKYSASRSHQRPNANHINNNQTNHHNQLISRAQPQQTATGNNHRRRSDSNAPPRYHQQQLNTNHSNNHHHKNNNKSLRACHSHNLTLNQASGVGAGQRRDHRSLSSSSSLASSTSSSPSSSLIQIYGHPDILRPKLHHHHSTDNNNHHHYHRQHHQHLSGRKTLQSQLSCSASSANTFSASSSSSSSSPPSSPASSTISTDESAEANMSPKTENVVRTLLSSTANMSLKSAPCADPYRIEPLFRLPYDNNNYAWMYPPVPTPNHHHHQPHHHHHHNLHPHTAHQHQHQNFQQQQHLSYQNNNLGLYPAPPPRPWLHHQQQHKMASAVGAGTNTRLEPNQHQPEFTVISYNVLCDRMVNNEIFPSSPDIALNWFYRRELILRQLLEFSADIIALQELELEQYETHFRPDLCRLGHYDSIFEPKSRARTMDADKRKRVDGCAIFFKMNKFKLIQRNLLEFNQIAMANAHGSEAMLNRVMTKDNIGLAAILEFIKPAEAEMFKPMKPNTAANFAVEQLVSHNQQPQRILVCNTHIHWDPEYCDVKLIQTIMLMNELECIAKHYLRQQERQREQLIVGATCHLDSTIACEPLMDFNSGGGDLLPLVLLGDFNSLPSSGVTNYLTSGKINSLHKDFKNYKYTSCSNALAIHGNLINYNNYNNLRRQSSPAWCFYSSSSSSSSPNSSSESSSSSSDSNSTLSGSDGLSPPVYMQSGGDNGRKNGSRKTADVDESVLNYNHPFRLVSAYEKDTMPYTNYTTKFKATIDYIFYSEDSLQLLGLLGPLDKNWLKGNRIKGLPQPHLPSDHLPLLVKLKLTGNSKPPQPPATTTIHQQVIINNDNNNDYSRSSLGAQGVQSPRLMNSISPLKHEQNRS